MVFSEGEFLSMTQPSRHILMPFPAATKGFVAVANRFSTGRLGRLIFLAILFPVLLLMFSPSFVVAEDTPELAEKLWNRAMDLQGMGERQEAANTFLRVYHEFPRSAMAEDSLWRSIQFYRQQASSVDRSQWHTVQELSRQFNIDFPESQYAIRVNFDLGLLHFEQEQYREALTRFKLFVKKFPDSPLVVRAHYLQAKALLRTGQIEAAESAYAGYAKSVSPEEKAKGLAGLGEIYNRRGEFEKALKMFRESLELAPMAFLNKPEADVYREFGTSYLRLGNEEYGRQQLFRYLNIVGQVEDRFDVLLEIAESYSRQRRSNDAQGLYELIISEGGKDLRASRVAQFRLLQYRDNPDTELSKWQRRGDYQDREEDASYENLLNDVHAGDMAQQARRGLFRRYQARNEFQPAFDIARSFLRQLDEKTATEDERQSANGMLLYLVETLLGQERYKDVYEFYEEQHRHVLLYPEGRLLYLVGQALEKLALYREATILYFRALALPLTAEDKIDLYYRRVGLYLTMKDYSSADVLLDYLRADYADAAALGELSYLSGNLREKQGRYNEALAFYAKAAEVVTFPAKKKDYAEAHLRLLLMQDHLLEGGERLAVYQQNGWLEPAELQPWYVEFGRKLVGAGKLETARDEYAAALDEKMPEAGRLTQKARLEFGDVLLRLGEVEAAQAQYTKAQAGADTVLQKLAAERLKQQGIDAAMQKIDLPVR